MALLSPAPNINTRKIIISSSSHCNYNPRGKCIISTVLRSVMYVCMCVCECVCMGMVLNPLNRL